jgi:nicotinic acid mononucleotide adenylyltransferase
MSGEPKAPAASLSKVAAALATGAAGAAQRPAFLVLPGSFNPVHTQHVRALEVARDAMAKQGWHVIGGFLAPSDDDYVRRKLGPEAWPAERRLALCRLAVADSSWIDVAPWAEYSSYRVTVHLRRTIESACRAELRGRPGIGVEVMGSDTLIRILGKLIREWESRADATAEPWYSGRLICCLARPSANLGAEMEQIESVIRSKAAAMGISIIVSGGAGGAPLLEVSSRDIRSAIARQQWDELRQRGWLAPSVLETLERGMAA